MKKNHFLFTCQWIGYRFSPQIYLSSANSYLGKVVSAFDATINIKMVNNELLVVTLGKIRSPISLNLFPAHNVTNGFRGLASYGSKLRKQDNETLLIGKPLRIDLNKSRIYRNNFEKPCYKNLKRFVKARSRIFDTLLKTARRGCLLVPDFTTSGLLSKSLAQIQRFTQTKDNKRFVEQISNTLLEFCGKGPGYTPSGDDFMCGYCVLFNKLTDLSEATDISLHHKKIVNSTTWMSSKLIEYSEKCIVDEQIQEMINSVSTGDPEKYMSLLCQISHRGHTSGTDIGIGMTAALYTIIDRKFHTEFLSMFPHKKGDEKSL
ncbi:MAG TPA: DUF2877 domain-containing protein [Nitrososphaeraceae archaeon]|nr:DUF2877 domain-containing protein [Nitrososphaeraceae archaeon]